MYKFVQNLDSFLCLASRKFHTKPDFTKNIYKVVRGSYNTIDENHLCNFQKILGDNRIVTDLTDLERYNVDWIKQLRGSSTLVLKPKTTEHVSKILSFCNENKLAVCIQGGNTGLSGYVPIFDEIVISMESMNQIINYDDKSDVLVCEAGCILENLNTFLEQHNSIVPLDLGSRGSCQIGGNLATNAGGIRLLRYGNLHGNVLGVEVVKANGEIVDCLGTLKKDNTGYHLKNIFIGSEGTLGLITKVAIQCPPKFQSIGLAFLGVKSFEDALKIYQQSKLQLGEILSAVEVIDDTTMKLVNNKLNLQSPIGNHPFYLMIETLGSNEEHDSEKLNTFLEHCYNSNHILNGTVTTEPAKYDAMWSIRERIPEAIRLTGHMHLYDVTLPLEHFYTLVSVMKKHVNDESKIISGFGHLGDGNLHIQVLENEYSEKTKNLIEPYIYEQIKKLNGSISAEHGIGFLKADKLKLVKHPSHLNLMKNLKTLFDPNGILNPYKMLEA